MLRRGRAAPLDSIGPVEAKGSAIESRRSWPSLRGIPPQRSRAGPLRGRRSPPQARYSTGRQSRPGHRSTGRHLRPSARPNPHARTATDPGRTAAANRSAKAAHPTRAARPPPVIRQDLSPGGAHGVRERLPSVDSGLLFWRRTGRWFLESGEQRLVVFTVMFVVDYALWR